MADVAKLHQLLKELSTSNTSLIAVSKLKSVDEILQVYNAGQLDFGENYVQELTEKHQHLPENIHWHFIGHLQSNKVKLISPFVYLIHGVDSLSLLNEISKQATKFNRTIGILLQVYIANEETKYGFDIDECEIIFNNFLMNPLPGINIRGLMGMASFTDNTNQIRSEFRNLKMLFDKLHSLANGSHIRNFDVLSMGMSSDYKIAVEEGSTMVRIGSMIFGERLE